ncbi:MAG TPA: helix-turn-helix transcriptional regulator [Kribbella sp.]
MGRLWDIVQRHIDSAPYPPSERQIAAKLGVSPTTVGNWRDPKKLPTRENLEAIAELAGVRYSVVLDAALYDTGYHEATVVTLRRRPVTTVQAELRAAQANLDEWDALKHRGKAAEGHRRELRSRVDALKAEAVASRRATGDADSVAEL